MRKKHINLSISEDILLEAKRLCNGNLSEFIDNTLRKMLELKIPVETMRVCVECDHEYKIDEFIQHKGKGIFSKSVYCHKCRRKRRSLSGGDRLKEQIRSASRKRYRNNITKERIRGKRYYEKNRKTVLLKQANKPPKVRLEKNHKNRQKWWERHESELERGRKYYAINKEKISARIKEYRRLNPDVLRNYRALRRASIAKLTIDVTRESIAGRIEVYGHACAYCGSDYEHLDHVKSVAMMGVHCPSNIRPACKKCNLQKGRLKFTDWLKRKGKFTGLPTPNLPDWF